jgi:hypothetical protein
MAYRFGDFHVARREFFLGEMTKTFGRASVTANASGCFFAGKVQEGSRYGY